VKTITAVMAARLLNSHPRHVRWLIKQGHIQAELVWVDELGMECWQIERRSVLAYAKRKLTGWPRGTPRLPISTRAPAVTVEYSQNGKRVTKHFARARQARRFYAFQDRSGNHPKVVSEKKDGK